MMLLVVCGLAQRLLERVQTSRLHGWTVRKVGTPMSRQRQEPMDCTRSSHVVFPGARCKECPQKVGQEACRKQPCPWRCRCRLPRRSHSRRSRARTSARSHQGALHGWRICCSRTSTGSTIHRRRRHQQGVIRRKRCCSDHGRRLQRSGWVWHAKGVTAAAQRPSSAPAMGSQTL